jgi:hypothetical protein
MKITLPIFKPPTNYGFHNLKQSNINVLYYPILILSGTPNFIPVFFVGFLLLNHFLDSVLKNIVWLFVPFPLSSLMSVLLRFAISNYRYGISKLFFSNYTLVMENQLQWLPTGQWFSPGFPVSSTNKTDRHDITKILLKVALSTIKP